MTCKDCIHYELCELNHKAYGSSLYKSKAELKCNRFKDKSQIVELPCKVGETLYDISEFIEEKPCPEMYEIKAYCIEILRDYEDCSKLMFSIDNVFLRPSDFGKTVFLTKEAAEKALKEREK